MATTVTKKAIAILLGVLAALYLVIFLVGQITSEGAVPSISRNYCRYGILKQLRRVVFNKYQTGAMHNTTTANNTIISVLRSLEPDDRRAIPTPSSGEIYALLRRNEQVLVALGCAVTTRDLSHNFLRSADDRLDSLPFFRQLLPSFLMTASFGYRYVFYIAYDFVDNILTSPEGREAFRRKFTRMVHTEWCTLLHVELVFVRCSYTGKPAWAQNDAMVAAYTDNITYFYMVNDDTLMTSQGWTEAFIATLQAMKPPNVGVVGPNHIGGNEKILTYHFLHRTHIDIFHYFYPRNFTGWYGDDWITRVYMPNNSRKLEYVSLRHALRATRYSHVLKSPSFVSAIVNATVPVLNKYINASSSHWRATEI